MKKLSVGVCKTKCGGEKFVLTITGLLIGDLKFILDSDNIVSEYKGDIQKISKSPYQTYIHYHEYDHNYERPLLVVSGDYLSAGYYINVATGRLTSTCTCAAKSASECCCLYEEDLVI
jgi:hypothetical protein